MIYIHNIHACIYRYKYILLLLFSITISAATVIKATKYSTYYIIHNSYDVATKLKGVSRLFLIYSQKLLWKTKILVHGHVKVFLNSVKFPLIVLINFVQVIKNIVFETGFVINDKPPLKKENSYA